MSVLEYENMETSYNTLPQILEYDNPSVIESFLESVPQGELNYPYLLSLACKHRNINIVRQLINSSKINKTEDLKDSLLFSCYIGYIEIVKYLIEMGGANIHVDNEQPLSIGCETGNLELVKYVVEQSQKMASPVDIHVENDYPLCVSCEKGYIEIVKYLVEQGANVHADDGYCICIATQNCNVELVEYLLSKGANISSGNHYPILISVKNKNNKLIKLLLSYYSDLNANDELLLCLACESGNMEMLEYIVNRTIEEESRLPNLSVKNNFPFVLCIKHNHFEIFNYLLSIYDTKALNVLFRPLLLSAAKYEQIEIFICLLDLEINGTSVRNIISNINDVQNFELIETIFKICSTNGCLEIIKIFEDYDEFTVTPDVLFVAVKNKKHHIVEYFLQNNKLFNTLCLNHCIYLASKIKDYEMIVYLANAGADIHVFENIALTTMMTDKRIKELFHCLTNCECQTCEQFLLKHLN